MICEGTAEDELFRWKEGFGGGGSGNCQGGSVDSGELGDGVFGRLDAVCALLMLTTPSRTG